MNQLIGQLSVLVNPILTLARLLASVLLALLVLATIVTLAGHQLPYIPAIGGDLTGRAALIAALAYYLK